MLVEFSIVPMGVGESVSKEVAKVIDIIDRSGLNYRTHAMGTIIEGDWEQCLALIKQCHDAVRAAAPRVYTRIAIDDRAGGKSTMDRKLKSVREKLGREFKE
ncbi:MAG: MTH1187 family thiamine-binding protein [candidate division Zixibacteria bacterium]|nr:MTH1187 family thiamine-binding protein [candidate division Zixibacteria bacterium]